MDTNLARMHHFVRQWLVVMGTCLISLAQAQPVAYTHPIPFAPAQYICYKTAAAPVVDGILEPAVWQAIPWSSEFMDIEGENKPIPEHPTRVKLTWDHTYLYIAAQLSEPQVWATLTERDAVIYQDDDFEVFIDPDGDGKNYAELEINALNTVWDLLLLSPYYQHSPPHAINQWDIGGWQHAVHIDGTLNQPGDTDTGWTVEMAIPFQSLLALSQSAALPTNGSTWRINFSRVDWLMEPESTVYTKKRNPATQRPYPERNWVWSPTGRIDMHRPETWGLVQFSTRDAATGLVPFHTTSTPQVQWALWQLYYSQRIFHEKNGTFAVRIEQLGTPTIHWPGFSWQPVLHATAHSFVIQANDAEGNTWEISHGGQLRAIPNQSR